MKKRTRTKKTRTKKQRQINIKEISKAEDKACKISAEFFGSELLKYFRIKGEIKEVFPTEINYLELKQLFQDFNYLMEDDSCCHVEFESDNISKDDLRRFRAYEAVTSYTYKKAVNTHVVCSANVKQPLSVLQEGMNTYRINTIRMKDGNADEVFSKMKGKSFGDVTKDDLMEVILSPLMDGGMAMSDRIEIGFQLLDKDYPLVSREELRKMQAILYLFALKFLGREEVEKMEELRMTYFAKMMIEEGIEKGIEKGITRGRLITIISKTIKKMDKGKDVEVIAQELEEDLEMMRVLCDMINAHPKDSVEKIAELYQNAVA
ncbi:MAG: hypothetical protein IJ390_06805 [Lachnospiraceae bacterium]|nr:hypothetical protein [Lachnospiraceae bacterium]